MGAIAEAIVAYGKPLIDASDGSPESIQRAMALTQLCYNLALATAESREESLQDLKSNLNMDDEELMCFKRDVVTPMIKRHEEMFGSFHEDASEPKSKSLRSFGFRKAGKATELFPGTGPYDPCPCGSGSKYRFCCKKKTPQ